MNRAIEYRSLGVLGWLLVIWIMSFPLRNLYLFGNISLDNILVPILIVLWCISTLLGGETLRLGTMVLVLSVLVVGVGLDHRLYQGGIEFRAALWAYFRDLGYFFVPVLLTTTVRRYRYVNAGIIYICAAGAVSSLLVALGLLNLDYVRIDESRIGIDALPKATGVFTNFGDLALLGSYSVACLLAYKGEELPLNASSKIMKVVILICLMMGIVGTQSRNFLISIIVSYFSFKFMLFIAQAPASKRQNYFVISITAFFMLASVTIFFMKDIAWLLSNLGGGQASNTALARLESYRLAAELVSSSILSGVSYLNSGNVALAEQMHNLWIGLLLRGGILSVLSMLFIIVCIMRGVFRVLKFDQSNREALVIGTFTTSMLISTMFFPGGSIIHWFMLGVAMNIYIRRDTWLRRA